jgi:hypothetical protein
LVLGSGTTSMTESTNDDLPDLKLAVPLSAIEDGGFPRRDQESLEAKRAMEMCRARERRIEMQGPA